MGCWRQWGNTGRLLCFTGFGGKVRICWGRPIPAVSKARLDGVWSGLGWWKASLPMETGWAVPSNPHHPGIALICDSVIPAVPRQPPAPFHRQSPAGLTSQNPASSLLEASLPHTLGCFLSQLFKCCYCYWILSKLRNFWDGVFLPWVLPTLLHCTIQLELCLSLRLKPSSSSGWIKLHILTPIFSTSLWDIGKLCLFSPFFLLGPQWFYHCTCEGNGLRLFWLVLSITYLWPQQGQALLLGFKCTISIPEDDFTAGKICLATPKSWIELELWIERY